MDQHATTSSTLILISLISLVPHKSKDSEVQLRNAQPEIAQPEQPEPPVRVASKSVMNDAVGFSDWVPNMRCSQQQVEGREHSNPGRMDAARQNTVRVMVCS